MTDSMMSTGLLRSHEEGDHQVTPIELFFDLVYVFAVTQLSHFLLGHLSTLGIVQMLIMLLAIWRAWIDTAWVTNWFDPNQAPVRFMLVGVMLVSLIMSAALPEAFGERGWIFAGTYVALQIGRSSFIVANLDSGTPLRRNFQRILAWSIASGALWLAGGVSAGSVRTVLWLCAVGVEEASAVTGFFTPGLGRSRTTDWTIIGDHLAERCQLFVLIALGESILITGATLGGMSWSVAGVGGLIVAFTGTVALWWIYFYRSADYGRTVIAAASDPGRLGRSAYTYFHIPMVAGIIIAAVANDLVIGQPGGRAAAIDTAVILGGPALFLAGHAMFKWSLSGRIYPSRLVTIAALAALIPISLVAPLLLLAAMTSLVLVALAAWETYQSALRAQRESEDEVEIAAPLTQPQATQ